MAAEDGSTICKTPRFEIKAKTEYKTPKNTGETIEWFKSIPNKTRKSFIQLDIVDYYPSISKKLFDQVIDFASKLAPISDLEKKILHNARKSVLFYDNDIWSKKTGLFDITMGAYDGAQITDLVGIYILHMLKKQIPQIDFGLYRDDGLGVHKESPLMKWKELNRKYINYSLN